MVAFLFMNCGEVSFFAIAGHGAYEWSIILGGFFWGIVALSQCPSTSWLALCDDVDSSAKCSVILISGGLPSQGDAVTYPFPGNDHSLLIVS